MKLLLLLTPLLAITNFTYCQEPENTKVYEIRNSIAVIPCYITGKRMYQNDKFYNPPFGAKFIVVRPLNAANDTIIIRYLLWTSEKDSGLRRIYNDPLIARPDTGNSRTQPDLWSGKSDSTTAKNDYENKIQKYFLIPKYDLDSNCVKVYKSGLKSTVFTIGLVTMPLKLRLGNNFDFQGNLSLGSTAGIKVRLSKYSFNYINLLFGASISTISLDSFNTKGKVIGQPITNMAVFSPSFGAVFEFGKAQAGIFYGWDILNKSTQSQYEWIYNKKPWVSIGFGFSIFGVDGKSNNSQPQTQ